MIDNRASISRELPSQYKTFVRLSSFFTLIHISLIHSSIPDFRRSNYIRYTHLYTTTCTPLITIEPEFAYRMYTSVSPPSCSLEIRQSFSRSLRFNFCVFSSLSAQKEQAHQGRTTIITRPYYSTLRRDTQIPSIPTI